MPETPNLKPKETITNKITDIKMPDRFENWEINSRIDNAKLSITNEGLRGDQSKMFTQAYDYLIKSQLDHQKDIGRCNALNQLFLLSHGIYKGEQYIINDSSDQIRSKITDLFVQRYGFMAISKLPQLLYGMSDADMKTSKDIQLLQNFYNKLLPRIRSQQGVEEDRVIIMSYLITGHFEELVENSTPEMRSKYAYIIGEVEKQTKGHILGSEESLKGELFSGVSNYNIFLKLLTQSKLRNEKGLKSKLTNYKFTIIAPVDKINVKTGTKNQVDSKVTISQNKIPEYLQSTKLSQTQKEYLVSIIEPLKKLGFGGIILLESNIQALVSPNEGHEFDSIKNILTHLGAECEKNPNFKSDMIGKLLIDITGESKNPFDISDWNIESSKTLGILTISILIYFVLATLTGGIAASAISGAIYNYMKQELIDGNKTIDFKEILISGAVSAILCGAFAVGQSVIRTGITQGMTKELAKEAARKAFAQELGPIAQGLKQETKNIITKSLGNPIDSSSKKSLTELIKRIMNDFGEERIDTQIIQPYVIPIIK